MMKEVPVEVKPIFRADNEDSEKMRLCIGRINRGITCI